MLFGCSLKHMINETCSECGCDVTPAEQSVRFCPANSEASREEGRAGLFLL